MPNLKDLSQLISDKEGEPMLKELESDKQKEAADHIKKAMELLAKDGVSNPGEWVADYSSNGMGDSSMEEDDSEEDEEDSMPNKMIIISALKKRQAEESEEDEG